MDANDTERTSRVQSRSLLMAPNLNLWLYKHGGAHLMPIDTRKNHPFVILMVTMVLTLQTTFKVVDL